MSTYSDNNKRIAKNTIFLYIRMIFLMLLGLYTSRITLKTLGAENYGIYNVVGGVIVLFQFLNSALTGAMQRYLNFAIGENNDEGAKKVFSICMKVFFLLSIFLFILCETVGLFFLNHYLVIPTDRQFAANIVFHISSFTMIAGMLRIPFNSSIIATEKMSFFAYVSIIEGILKLALVFALSIGKIDKLILYAFLTFIVSLIMLLIYFIYCKIHIPFINFKKYKDKELLKSMMSFSGWNVFGSFASIAVNQGISFIFNHLGGVLVNAALGIANQVNYAVFGFLGNFQTAFNPQIVKSYAQNDMKYVFNFANNASKLSFFLIYFIILPLTINLKFVLSIWLPEVPDMSAEFIKILLIITVMDAITKPFFMLTMAEGNIKLCQIVGAISMLLILPVSYILLVLQFPPYSAFIVNLVQVVFFFIWRLFFLKKRIGYPIKSFFNQVFWRILIIILISYPSTSFIFYITNRMGNILQFFITCLYSCFILCLLYLVVGLNNNERHSFFYTVKSKFKKNRSSK